MLKPAWLRFSFALEPSEVRVAGAGWWRMKHNKMRVIERLGVNVCPVLTFMGTCHGSEPCRVNKWRPW